MAIRPIDAQIMVQKIPEVARLQTNNPSALQAQAGSFAHEFKKEVDIRDQQVNDTAQAERRAVDEDGKGSASYQRNKGQKNKQKAGKETNKEAKPDGSSFSIKG